MLARVSMDTRLLTQPATLFFVFSLMQLARNALIPLRHEPIAEENIYENLGAIRSGFTTDYRMRMTPPPAAAHAKVTTHDVACSPLIFTAHKSPAAATAAFGYLEESQTDYNSVPVTAYTAGSASKTTRGFNTITNFNATLKSPLNNTEQYAARASSSPKALGNYCATPDLGDTPEGTPLQERELKGADLA